MTVTQLNQVSLKTAALISGFCLLIMVVAAPIAEMYAYPKLIVLGSLAETVETLSRHRNLFTICILRYLATFILDVVVAWSLYVLLKPVNAEVSLLTALFRIVYTVVALVALLNLVSVYRIVYGSTAFTLDNQSLHMQVANYLNAFKSQWYFGLVFFSLHLIVLGFLVIKSSYIPTVFGVLLIITGLGYSLTTFKPFLFPNTNIDFAAYTFYGEIIFMFWLLIKGWKLGYEETT
ncbi:DUF4386 domain-containing protein [Segetibacter koreensis]|uniref:DUF4386 domain-containing protein n=1 Tax=Segetibacter koreensis TaxID=398037 RepID=UPI000372725C|nr:DUF4386 domain-containing protein [Segetibacter koreensis]